MSDVSTVFVAWNGGAASEAALDWAIERVCRVPSDLVLLRVVAPSAVIPGMPGREQFDAAAEETLEQARVVRLRVPDVHVDTRVMIGEVVPTIAQHTGPEVLMVVGSDGPSRHARSRAPLAVRVVGAATGPVAVVPLGRPCERDGVTVGVDDSEESYDAADRAALEAEASGQTLRVVHAWLQPSVFLDAGTLDEDALDDLQVPHQRVLDDAVAVIRGKHPTVEMRAECVRGFPADALLGGPSSPALIVVGRRRISRRRIMMLGSVSRDLLYGADVP